MNKVFVAVFIAAGLLASARSMVGGCQGNACDKVSITYDQANKQFIAHNHSNKKVVVSLGNGFLTTTVHVPPGGQQGFGMIQAYDHEIANYE